jgi:putative ABC transport system permease protein
MLHDIRYALRVIRRQPALAITTMATLGIGIAAATSIFTAVDRLLVRPLPYPAPHKLFVVENAPLSIGSGGFRLSEAMPALGAIADAGLFATGGLNVGTGAEPIRVPAATADAGFFGALAVPAALGRTYRRTDLEAGDLYVTVISDRLWRQLGEDQAVLDRPLTINLRPYRVLGVMPPGFGYPEGTDVWVPYEPTRPQRTGRRRPHDDGRTA